MHNFGKTKSWSGLFFSCILFFCFAEIAASQTAHPFKGRIIENDAYRTPLYGATVYFPDLEMGGTTNLSGYFSLENLPEGEHQLRISFVGYQTQEHLIHVPMEEELVFALEMDAQLLGELEVLADAEASAQMQQAGLSTIQVSALPLTHIPRLLGEPDLIRMVQNLPGVKTESDYTGGFFVRGGRNDQNLILLDGVPVYNPWHLFGIFSAFNTEALDRVELTKGVFPAKFGSRVSSVLDIGLQEGSERLGAGYLTVSPLSASFSYGRPINQNTSWLVALRRTYMDPIFWLLSSQYSSESDSEKHNGTMGYYFYDFNTKVVHRFSPKISLEAAWFRSSDQLKMIDETIYKTEWGGGYEDENIIGWRNNTASLKLNYRTPAIQSETQAFLSFYNSDNTESHERRSYRTLWGDSGISSELNFEEHRFNQRFRDSGFQQHLTLPVGERSNVQAGAQWMLHQFRDVSIYREGERLREEFSDGTPPVEYDREAIAGDSLSTRSHEFSVYLNSTLHKGDVSFHPGVRYEYYSLGGYQVVMPRINVSWQATPSLKFSAGYGHFSQYLQIVGLDMIRLPMDRWFWADESRLPVRSRMATAGFGYELPDWGRVTVEGYYKTTDNLQNFDPKEQRSAYGHADFFVRFGSETLRGNGEAYGVELFLEKTDGAVTGWLGYTLSWAWNTFPELNNGTHFPSRTDKRNDIQLFADWSFTENWSVGALFNFKTGQPVTFSTEHYLAAEDPLGIGDIMRQTMAITKMNNFRLPAYHRLDLNLAWKNRRIFKRPAELSFNVINVYNRFNVFSLQSNSYMDRQYDGNQTLVKPNNKYLGQLPVLPVLSLRIALGGDAQ